jgi:uncharacterized protein
VSVTPTPAPGARLNPGAMLIGAGVVWFVAFLASAVAAAVVLGDGTDVDDLTGAETFAVSLPLFTVLLTGTLILSSFGGREPARVLGLTPSRSGDFPLGLGVGVLTQFALIPIYLPLVQLFDLDVQDEAQDLSDRFNGNEVILLTLLALVIAPTVEELFFRGLVQLQLQKLLSPWLALLVASAAFALIHFQPIQWLGLFVFGVVSGLLLQQRSLVASIAAHVGFNAVALIGTLG